MFIRDSRRSYRTYSYAELILITDLYLLRNYTYGRLILIGSYTYSSQILFLFRFLVYCTELIHVRILISSLCLFRSPVGVTEPILIQRYLNTYWYLYLSQISRRSLQNLYLSYEVYTCSDLPVGIIEITEHILDLRNLILYGNTCMYYKTYTGTSYLICTMKYILVLRNLYWYF